MGEFLDKARISEAIHQLIAWCRTGSDVKLSEVIVRLECFVTRIDVHGFAGVDAPAPPPVPAEYRAAVERVLEEYGAAAADRGTWYDLRRLAGAIELLAVVDAKAAHDAPPAP